MNKCIFLLILVVGTCVNAAFSQNRTKEFEILPTGYKVPNSLYHSIELLDSRNDTAYMGVVQLGALNNQARVVPVVPLTEQLQKLLHSSIISSAKDGELVLQLWRLEFDEMSGMSSESGCCYFKAALYSKKDQQYQKLAAIDTIMVVKAFDVTKELLKGGSDLIADFISNNLTIKPFNPRNYTHREIVNIDSTDKRDIRVYNVDKYVEGLYYDYQSFCDQKPAEKIFVETKKNGKISGVKVLGDNNELIKIDPNEIYAIVYNGSPYISTNRNFYEAYRSEDDFYFKGRVKETSTSDQVLDATIVLGMAGGILASLPSSSIFLMKINHQTGQFIRIREIDFGYD